MPVAQNYKNHTRVEPRFHFFVAPVLLLNILVTMVIAVRYWHLLHWLGIWMVFVAVAVFMAGGLARDYGLKNQDRIIRLEERLRYQTVLPPAALAAAEGLSKRQILALRFAPDPELPDLLERTSREGLDPKQIKQSVQAWRADEWRI
jgi:hypothetical protein